jgi:RNA polymerase sigma-70 factor (ECF subfamily)
MSAEPEPHSLATSADFELVGGLAAGREQALAEIYRRHSGAVHGLARLLLVDRQLVDAVVEAVFLALWDAPHHADGKPLRWHLLHLARRACLELARARPDGAPPLPGVPGDDDVLGWAYAALTDAERQVVGVTFFGGLTCKEAAAWLGIPEGDVKRYLRSSLAHLARAEDLSEPA